MACQEFRKEVDAVFPERISRLHRGAADGASIRRKQRRFLNREVPTPGAIGRYRTQPVTFDEIKEVDEEMLNEDESLPDESAATVAQSEEDLMQQKFQKLRLRRRGSQRTNRRALLRPSNSHDESDFDNSFTPHHQPQSSTNPTQPPHHPFLSST